MNMIKMVAGAVLGMLLLFGIAAAVSLDDPYFGDESKIPAGPGLTTNEAISTWYKLEWKPPVAVTPLPTLPVITNYQPSASLLTKKTVATSSAPKSTNSAFHKLKIANSVTLK
jgi:hypothetical protein